LVKIKPGQPNLNRARIVEPTLSCKIHLQTLCERRQPLHTLRTVKEGGRSRYNQQQARKASSVNFVDPLAHCVEAAIARLAPHPLQRLDFV